MWSRRGAHEPARCTRRNAAAAYPARVSPGRRHPDDPRARSPQRREPGWGDVESLEFHRPRRYRRRFPRRWVLWGAGAVALVLLACLVLYRQTLAERLWPQNRAQALSEQAAAALARGHLTAPDASGARELYEAAIAIDPDRLEAREGLARVAQAALEQARQALGRDDFVQAHRMLALARSLNVPRAGADALALRVREREAEVAGIEGLLVRAAEAREQGRLDGDGNAALPLYRRVLALRPRNVAALEGREDALSELLAQAHAELQAGRVEEGARLVAAASGYDPGHVDLPQLRGELARAIDGLRRRAADDLRTGALERAAERYAQLRRIDPEDAEAGRGMAAVADAWARRAEQAAADFDFPGATAALLEARRIAPDAAAIERAGRRIENARRTRERLLPSERGDGSGRRAQVGMLLGQAAAAESRGDLLTPPGESAYDKLRAARALAPDDPAVRRAQARFAPQVRACFERELPRNDLGQARVCLDAWVALEGEGGATRQARRRLARRWLAVGEERLRAGELAGARAALESAAAVDPGTPEIPGFRQRLRSASASGD